MTSALPENLRAWLYEPPARDVRLAIERLARTDDVMHVAIMPDVHLANEVCIGSVVATAATLLPDAVGGDIGCGMAAVAFEAGADLLASESNAMRLLGELRRRVPTNRHRGPRNVRSLPDDFKHKSLSSPDLSNIGNRDGIVQLGTLGRGNHFLEFQSAAEGGLWLMVHSGSRAVGQAVRAWHVKRAARTNTGLSRISADSHAGRAYLQDVAWSRAYAAANRRAMIDAAVEAVRDLFGVRSVEGSFFDCDHNHVLTELHFGQNVWVHRKGAMSASEGERGIIPGSMGDSSFHVVGRGEASSLRSSSHGAGRALPRGIAASRTSTAELHRQLRGIWFDQRMAASLRDESPAAYKEIAGVMRAQRDLTRIERKLRPLLSYKGT